MKIKILLLAALSTWLFSACDDDPFLLELQTFDVRWYDDDGSQTQTMGDALTFGVQINTTDPDADDQFITEWDFTYYVNNQYGGVLRGDNRIETNSLYFDAEIILANLALPMMPSQGIPVLGQGDVIEFRLWARDNNGMEIERVHRYVLEE